MPLVALERGDLPLCAVFGASTPKEIVPETTGGGWENTSPLRWTDDDRVHGLGR